MLPPKPPRKLDKHDIPEIKHHIRTVYGWISEQEWRNISLSELFEMYPFVDAEYQKRDYARKAFLKSVCGVKNPK